MLIVIKFGGTSVKGGERIRGAAKLVKKVVADGHQAVVVTSAMGGMTNLLVGMLDRFAAPSADETQQVSQFLRFAKQLETEHVAAAKEAISRDDLRAEADNALYTERHNLERVLMGSHFLGELTAIAYDFIVSQGERMVVPVLTGSLRSLGVEAVGIGGNGAGIITDQNFGNARPNMQRTREEVRKTVLPLLQQGKTPVIAGFYGRTDQGTKGQGRIAVLGRGGSDYSATLIGAALDADEVWIMTDVDGVKTTDPRLVPAAYTIPEMPYQAASEMAMLGAKVLHQLSVVPCETQKIPLRIANTFEPEKPGTWLVSEPKGKPPAVWALTLTSGALVRLSAGAPARRVPSPAASSSSSSCGTSKSWPRPAPATGRRCCVSWAGRAPSASRSWPSAKPATAWMWKSRSRSPCWGSSAQAWARSRACWPKWPAVWTPPTSSRWPRCRAHRPTASSWPCPISKTRPRTNR